MATLEELSAALIKADAAGNTADAKAFADAIRQMQSAAPAVQAPAPSRGKAGFFDLLSAPFEAGMALAQKPRAEQAAVITPAVEALGAGVGGTLGSAAGPAGTVAGAGAGYAGAKELMRYIAGTATPETAPQAFQRVGENALTGATMEALGRGVIGPVLDKAAKAAGWVWDAASGTLSQVRAGKIIRQIAGADLDAIKSAAANAPQNLTAAQATQQVGNNVLAALGEKAAKNDVTNYFTRLAAEQEAARQAALRGVTPDLAAAQAAREAATNPLYGAADVATLPGRTRQFAPVQAGTVKGGVPMVDPLTGQPKLVSAPISAPAKGVPTTTDTIPVKVEVGRDSFNQPIFEIRQTPVTYTKSSFAEPDTSLMNAPKLVQDTSVGGAPIFKQVLTGYNYDPELANLLKRPAIQDAFNLAGKIAENRGVSMFTPEGKLTGQGAHLIKTAIDDAIAPAPGTAIAKNTAAALKSAKSAYLDWVEGNIPAYKQARETFAQLSVPVNQAQVLGEMQSVLAKPGGGERVTPFLNALGRGENALIKRAGGEPRFGGIEDVLSPEQMSVVNDIAGQFNRDLQLAQSAAAGRGGLSRILGETKSSAELPPSINLFTRTMNKVLSTLEGSVNRNTLNALEKGMRSGRDLTTLLNTLPTAQRNAALQALSSSAKDFGRVVTFGTNSLATQQAPVRIELNNMLAPD